MPAGLRIGKLGRLFAFLALAGWTWLGWAPLDAAAQDSCLERESIRSATRTLDLVGYTRLEYNDNINASGVQPLEDFIFKVGIDIRAELPVFQNNSLDLNFDLGFTKYFSHPELDSNNSFIDISPDSGVQYCMKIGQFTIGLFDHLRFDADPTDSLVVDPLSENVDFNILQYNRFANNGGLNVDWEVNRDTHLNIGFQREDILPVDSQFDFSRRTSNIAHLGAVHSISSNLRFGVDVTNTRTTYKLNFQNDSHGSKYGTFIDWGVTDFINLFVNLSWNSILFDSSGTNNDDTDVSGLNWDLLLRHELNRKFSHALAYYRRNNLGLISNSQLENRVQYSFNWSPFTRTTVTGLASFERGTDSGGLSPESFDRRVLQINYGGNFKNFPINWNVEYGYTEKTSNIPTRSYRQNRFEFSIRYDF